MKPFSNRSFGRLSLLAAVISLVAFNFIFSGCVSPTLPPQPNHLTAAERRANWKLLFDGHSLNGWRNFRKPDAPKQGWVIENGCLKLNGGGGDLITTAQFTDYDLQWDWHVAPKGNNGIKYLVTENRPSAPGPEYQMVDDSTMDSPKRMTASLYEIFAPNPAKMSNPPDQWNHSRILIQGKHVEHWLNGKKVVAYELESAELKAAIAQSKFKSAADFDKKIKGHILLTDHHDAVWYRNIKIRELPSGK